MKKTIYLLLGDQLSSQHPFLKRTKWLPGECLMMIESIPRTEWMPYHPQKLLYLFTCMRRFAHDLKKDFQSIPFEYIEASQKTFSQVINEELCDELHVVEPSEPRAREWIQSGLKARVVFHPNPFFLSDDSFLPAKPPYLLENFYRKMRVKLNLLMENGQPLGGSWNYDEQNRQPPDKYLQKNLPADFLNRDWFDELDNKIFSNVEAMLRQHVPADRFGSWEKPKLPTHHKTATQFLSDFVKNRLSLFGPYEDAMVNESNGLFHSGLSAPMNIQILSAQEIVAAVESADGDVPLSSKEGFIRQVIGWREFIRLVYLRHAGEYSSCNFFGFSGELPPLYWGAKTNLNCLAKNVESVRVHAYSHHIPRLMVLGNFALLTQSNPHEVNRWFWSVYLDAYEWVVSPNVLGMSQFADGGVFATKPYVSGANYINKMSNYCAGCKYDPKQTTGEDACPFNALYWNFIDETQRLKVSRPSFARRMGMMWSVWNKKTEEEKSLVRKRAAEVTKLAREGAL
ncbi:MAG: hypothetical protein RI953_370 [Pseudomonadota bacterium]|jgi:deoxyribodipyrimidine photolyase-related protein